jgi:hypothetical protein
MIPSLLMMRFGRVRRLWLPLPFFLIWPFWVLAWLIWLIITLFNRAAALKIAVIQMMLWKLRGLTVDVNAQDGTQIYFRFI